MQDGARTLAYVAAASIIKSAGHLPETPALYRRLRRRTAEPHHHERSCGHGRRQDASVIAAEEAGFNGDAMEAEAWAYLAVRSLEGLPLTFPGTTGVDAPVSGGVLARHDDGDGHSETPRLQLVDVGRRRCALVQRLHSTIGTTRYMSGERLDARRMRGAADGWFGEHARDGMTKYKMLAATTAASSAAPAFRFHDGRDERIRTRLFASAKRSGARATRPKSPVRWPTGSSQSGLRPTSSPSRIPENVASQRVLTKIGMRRPRADPDRWDFVLELSSVTAECGRASQRIRLAAGSGTSSPFRRRSR